MSYSDRASCVRRLFREKSRAPLYELSYPVESLECRRSQHLITGIDSWDMYVRSSATHAVQAAAGNNSCGRTNMADQKVDLTRKPPDNPFHQQRLRAWQPLMTPRWVIGALVVIGAVFVILGAICLTASMSVVELEFDQYQMDEASEASAIEHGNHNLTLRATVEEEMKAPVYMYYKLRNFYQNHRRYVKSRSDSQLKGDGSPDTAPCDPLETYNGMKLYPCGLIASSKFNDTFKMCTGRVPSCVSGSTGLLSLDKSDIIWKSDTDKFVQRSVKPGETTVGPNGPLANVSDPDLIVWMRTAGLPTFKKLYAIIHQDIPAGTELTLTVDYNFPVASFGGKKSVVLSTANWLGGRNDFLGGAFIAVGAVCLVLALAFGVKHHFSPRPLGSMQYFSWPGVSAPKFRS